MGSTGTGGMLASRFAGIPTTAKREERTYVVTPVENPFSDCTITYSLDGTEVIKKVGNEWIDLSSEYAAWLKTLPKFHEVSFKWEE